MGGRQIDVEEPLSFVERLQLSLPSELSGGARLLLATRACAIRSNRNAQRDFEEAQNDPKRMETWLQNDTPAARRIKAPIDKSTSSKRNDRSLAACKERAREVRKAANDFARTLDRWHEYAWPVEQDRNSRDLAEARLRKYLTPEEFEVTKFGQSSRGLRLVLCGLKAHLKAVQKLHKPVRRSRDEEARRLVDAAFEIFSAEGLPTAHNGDKATRNTLLVQTCLDLLKAAGIRSNFDVNWAIKGAKQRYEAAGLGGNVKPAASKSTPARKQRNG